MSVSSEIKRSVRDTRQAITDTKPLYALAGVGDLWVASMRETTARLQEVRIEPGDVQQRVTRAIEELQANLAAVQHRLVEQLAVVPDTASGMAERLVETYDDFAERGAVTVGRIRRQQASLDLGTQAQTTVSKTKATRTAARKAAAATATRTKATRTTARKGATATTGQAKGAVTSARKGATATTRQAKGAVTSARKTAIAARKATSAGAKKVG